MSQRRWRPVRNKGVIAAARQRRVPPPGARLAFQVDPWTRRLIRPVLMAVMATAPAVALLVIVQLGAPEEPWSMLTLLCFFAALEGVYTTAWLHHPNSRGVDRGIYRAAELLLLVVLSRIVSWVLFGDGLPSPAEVRLYLAAPLSFFLAGGFITTVLTTLVAWWLAVSASRIFTQLDVSEAELQYYTLSFAEQKAQADDRPIQVPRQMLQEQYLRQWLTGGMIMVLLAALSTYEMGELATVANPFEITRLGLDPGMLLALLVYFLAGLWLLSHARMLRLNALWLFDGMAKDVTVERGWQRSSLLLLLVIALGAAFLPIGSSFAISRILSAVLNGLLYVIGMIYSIIGFLFASLLASLTNTVGQEPIPTPEIAPMPTPVVPPATTPPPTASPELTFIISSAFWALLIAIIIGALIFFLRERGYRVEWGEVRGRWATVSEWIKAFWLNLRRRARRARRDLRERLAPHSSAPTQDKSPLPRPRFIRLGALSPREQIRYYYLATVRRAGERGVARRQSDTPLEYAEGLKAHWPEAGEDLQGLTDAFLEARYSPQPIEKSAAERIRDVWKRVKARLRASREHDQQPTTHNDPQEES